MKWEDAFSSLAAKGTTNGAGGQRVSATSAEVTAFEAHYTSNNRPTALKPIVKDFHLNRDGKGKRNGTGPLNRHQAEFSALCWAARGAMAGKFPATVARDAIESASMNECAKRDEVFDAVDFDRSWADAIARAVSRGDEAVKAQENRKPTNGVDVNDFKTHTATESQTMTATLNGEVTEAIWLGNGTAGENRNEHESEAENELDNNKPLDLRRLRTEASKPIEWLEEGVLSRGGYVSVSSAPGCGKSILGRGIAVDASLGRSHLDPLHTFEPAKVVYLDFENGEDWWRDGLEAMKAPLDLPNLAVLCYPDVGGLDTESGSQEFLKLIQKLNDDLGGIDVLMLDTVSRVVDGDENSADTWSRFYKFSMLPLRRCGVTLYRMDHLGKDADKGPRGSSHKLSDVDADFRLTAATQGSNDLRLKLGKRRRQHFVEALQLQRLDGPLRHEINLQMKSLTVTLPDGSKVPTDLDVVALVADLDRLGIDRKAGRLVVQHDYKHAGGLIQTSTLTWAAAVKYRKANPPKPAQQTP